MKATYENKKYMAEFDKKNNNVILYSYTKDSGFQNHIDPWGNKADDFFSRIVSQSCLSYMWNISYQVKFKNRWYNLHTALNRLAVIEEHYEITLSFLDNQEQKLAEELAFKRTDKFYYTKRLYRSDIEALKVIESPQGIFAKQGEKEQILTGQEIDIYLSTIVNSECK